MELKIPKKSGSAEPLPSPVDTAPKRRTPRVLTTRSNPLAIEGCSVFGVSNSAATVSGAVERLVRESMACTRDPLSVRCVFHIGRLMGLTQNRDIVLPVETECVLDNNDSKVAFIPEVPPTCINALYMDMFTNQAGGHRLAPDSDHVEVEIVSSSNVDQRTPGDALEGFHHTRIYRVPYSTDEGLRLSEMQCCDHNVLNTMHVYRPQSQYHYRLQTSSAVAKEDESDGVGLGMTLKLCFRYMRNYKTTAVSEEKLVRWELNIVDHWDVVLNDEMTQLPIERLFECFTTCLVSKHSDMSAFPFFDREVVEDGRRHYVQLSVHGSQLGKQFQRLTECKANRFGYIVSLVHSNLRMILDSFDSMSVDEVPTADFYPNLFGDTAEAVQFHYDTRKLVRQKGSAIEALRRHNNLVKRVMIACYVRRKDTVLDLACGHCQDLDKYATVGISHVMGIDISLSEIMEARRRYSEQLRGRRFRFKAEFHHGNLLDDRVYATYVRNKKFDVVSMQLAIHYIISDEASASMMLRHIHQALGDKGIFIGSTVCCNAIAKGLIANPPHQTSDDAGQRWDFGNSIFRVTMEDASMEKLFDAATGQPYPPDALISRLENQWGLKYHFFLMESIDASEYVVPWRSFAELCTRLGFRLLETFTFPEYMERAPALFRKLESSLTANVLENVLHHLRVMSTVEMSTEQREAFMLYRIFVFEKVTGRDRLYMQGVKIRRSS
ncbi:mRNA capping enzyme, large subunit family protein, putative [Babesia bigemina]|uniref:mRNA (guanine-N(7))-methyltransferase n=1 Tax=Babesia bigemina TaxID=5866 RepID=A0A061DA86_BABBI|nr:mRNA capping enzyme, large subunit family protein, putative [Babesia bigemina]CDR96877.1 mRNA capping enzyme, large subunit family protein, putative [Babesia bigemina]|eukprot:XP_012769063.1 mRNA capping enzyme, large subunit family protein, putative [Babesia bigemina]